MNECLITKLKGSVSDNTLPKLGVAYFLVNSSTDVEAADRRFEFATKEGCVITTPKDYPIEAFSNGERIASNIVRFNAGSSSCTMAAGTYQFEVSEKYGITAINSYSNSRVAEFDYNFNNNDYLIGVEVLYINPNSLMQETTIEDISKCCPNVSFFHIGTQNSNFKILGHMADFSQFKNITAIEVYSESGINGGGIKGSVESYVECAVDLGKRDVTVGIIARGAYVAFNGEHLATSVSGGSTRYKLFCVFTDSVVEVYGNVSGTADQGTDILGTYNIASRTWEYTES